LNVIEQILSGLTPEQARAAAQDGNIVAVRAGAGTGKTWVLTRRFVATLFNDPECLPRDILTLTYTDAAAREMRERVERAVLDFLPLLPEPRQRDVRDGLDEVWISTIHSFASRLIRIGGLALDVDPGFSVVSAPREDAFWEGFTRAVDALDFSGMPYQPQVDHPLRAAVEKWGAGTLSNLAREVIETHASLDRTPSTLLRWAAKTERESDSRLAHVRAIVRRDVLRGVWDDAWSRWGSIFDDLASEIAGAKHDKEMALLEVMRRRPADPKGLVNPEGLVNPDPTEEVKRQFFVDVCSNVRGGSSKLFKMITERLGMTAGDWRKANKAMAEFSQFLTVSSDADRQVRAALLRLCAAAWEAWNETKRRSNLLSFSDMISLARRALKAGQAKGVMRPQAGQAFRHVLIDEFQDTDRVQYNLILQTQSQSEKKLFIVGDVKQAIYGFRHADPSLFEACTARASALGLTTPRGLMTPRGLTTSSVPLDVSFRTRASLLRHINSLFASVWGNSYEPLRPVWSLMTSDDRGHETPSGGIRDAVTVEPLTVLLSEADGPVSEARERGAAELACLFSRWVGEGRTVWDKGDNKARPVRWGDFAVLTPTRGEYEVLERAFDALGIPAVFVAAKSYFSRGEVTDVVNTLRAAASPEDEAALAGWLCSPFSGLSPDEAMRSIEDGTIQAAAARTPIERLRRIGALRGPSAILSSLLEVMRPQGVMRPQEVMRPQADSLWLSSVPPRNRERVTANVRHAAALAAQYEAAMPGGVAGCARWLDMALRAGRDVVEPESVDENAVHVMTVHAAKGLEFPVVAVVRAERGIRNPKSTAAPSTLMGVAVSALPDELCYPPEEDSAHLSLHWDRVLTSRSEAEESMRLFYVAATRARDALVICGTRKNSAGGAGEKATDKSWLATTLSWLEGPEKKDVPIIHVPSEAQAPNPAHFIRLGSNDLPPAGVSQPRGVSQPQAVPLPAATSGALASFSATSFALFEWCPLAWRRKYRQGLDLKWEIPDTTEDEYPNIGGADLGSLAHWVLANWDLREESLSQWLGELSQANGREPLTAWLTRFAATDEGINIRRRLESADGSGAHDLLMRESPFRVSLHGVRLVGTTDVAWRDGDKWSVRDYKITAAADASGLTNLPDELYTAQLDFYALALEMLTGVGSVSVGLIFLREGAVRLWEARSLEDIAERVRRAAEEAACGPWLPKDRAGEKRCPRCPFSMRQGGCRGCLG
jgi:ATP-dependent exoDNAse (exonuclease V) beta subunit